jgi:polyvinyl alcohol dehydrogenase (cytochrome)
MRHVIVWAVVALSVPAVVQAQSAAPDGEAVYRQHCAGCHNGTMPRMPNRDALKTLTPEHVETALSSFSMRRQGAALTLPERRAVAEYVTGSVAGSYRAPLEVIPKSAYCAVPSTASDPLAGAAWNGFGGDARNTRFAPAAAAGLSPAAVPRLKLKWAFGFPGVSASGSQVTVAGNRAFVGSRNGVVYALEAKSGCIVWAFEADAGVRSTPVVGGSGAARALYFGDANAQAYSLDIATGKLRWKVKVDTHQDAIVTGAVAFANGRVYVPVSSMEEGTAVIPSYECCTFRGSVSALDAATGKVIWKTYTINEAPQKTAKTAAGTQLWGPSGGGVWSTPALDPERNRIYVATGDNYSNPPTNQSDAIMALAMDTGRVLWVRQTLAGDSWNTGCLEAPNGVGRAHCPSEPGPDHDFASAPALATIAGGRRILLAGQKSGMLYGLNPDTGDYIWKTQVGDGGVLGGIEWGFAVDNTRAYVSLSSAFEKKAGEAGGIAAVDLADGKIKWRTPPAGDTCKGRTGCSTGQPAAVSAIPGMVFSASLDGHLRGYEAETGQVIFDTDTAHDFTTVNNVKAKGGSMNGPGSTIVNGTLFVSSGYGSLGFMPGNVLLAFSVDGK